MPRTKESRTHEHSWIFDGDDPYVVCSKCGERRDALTDRVVTPPTKESRNYPSLAVRYAEGTTCSACNEPCSAGAPCSCCRRGDELIAALSEMAGRHP